MPPPAPSITRIEGPWRHLQVHANGIRFHVVEGENPQPDLDIEPETDRPLVIFLHGFGSFWWSWRHQLTGLSGARVVAVDLRGYGDSDKPPASAGHAADDSAKDGVTAGIVTIAVAIVLGRGRSRRRRGWPGSKRRTQR